MSTTQCTTDSPTLANKAASDYITRAEALLLNLYDDGRAQLVVQGA